MQKSCLYWKDQSKGNFARGNINVCWSQQTQWSSQAVIGTMALGNLLVAASISFTGNTFTRIKEFCDVLSLSVAKMSSFLKIQKKYLLPVINHFYIKPRNKIVSELKTHTALDVIGDRRCSSPSSSAKYGTHSFMVSQWNKIIDFTLINVVVLQILLWWKNLVLLNCLKEWKRRMALKYGAWLRISTYKYGHFLKKYVQASFTSLVPDMQAKA